MQASSSANDLAVGFKRAAPNQCRESKKRAGSRLFDADSRSVKPKSNWFGKAVSRFLSSPLRTERIICLSSQYPEPVSLSRNMERAAPGSPIWPCTRWGFPCLVAYASSGGLLHHLFTLTGILANPGGIFSVALSVGTPHNVTSRVYPSNAELGTRNSENIQSPSRIPRWKVTRHRALRCSDFPPPAFTGSDSPPFQNRR
jgi:hypothetical protein